VGHARTRKIPAQLVEDEEYQLRHERVAGIDIAKAKADVCTRLPPAREGGRRASRTEDSVPATAKAIIALAARLLADGVELVVMESTPDYWRIWVRHEVAHIASELADWRAGLCGSAA
jgi:sarcosine oxidase gamma subunit